jgi:hypothetical protein
MRPARQASYLFSLLRREKIALFTIFAKFEKRFSELAGEIIVFLYVMGSKGWGLLSWVIRAAAQADKTRQDLLLFPALRL